MMLDSIFLDLRLIWRNVLEKVAHHPESLLKKLRQVLLRVIIRSIKREKSCLMVIGRGARKRKRKRNDQSQKRTTPEVKNLKFPRTSALSIRQLNPDLLSEASVIALAICKLNC